MKSRRRPQHNCGNQAVRRENFLRPAGSRVVSPSFGSLTSPPSASFYSISTHQRRERERWIKKYIKKNQASSTSGAQGPRPFTPASLSCHVGLLVPPTYVTERERPSGQLSHRKKYIYICIYTACNLQSLLCPGLDFKIKFFPFFPFFFLLLFDFQWFYFCK